SSKDGDGDQQSQCKMLDTQDTMTYDIRKNDQSVLQNLYQLLLMGFSEFYKELEAEILGDEAQFMGLQFLLLELRFGKIPSRILRSVKSAEILWQFWASSSFGVSLAHDGSWRKWEPSF
ncbi:hypothetical protein Tco_1134175, partial [Tanacetum coccineum]